METIDLGKTIYTLTEQYPELIDILKEIGFNDIVNPAVRKTAGRVMTLPKGCALKGISLERVKQTLAVKGYEVEGGE